MDVLIDVNVIFALVNERHGYHERSCHWLDAQGPGFRMRVCRIVQMGLIRLLCNASAMDRDPLKLPEAWKIYAELMKDPAVAFLPEPPGIVGTWIQFCNPFGASPKVLTDAYLAAVALHANLPLATFDGDFGRFPGIRLTAIP